MRKSFLQLYNEIFENKDLRQLRDRILQILNNIMQNILNYNFNSNTKDEIYGFVSNAYTRIELVFIYFFNKSYKLDTTLGDIDIYLSQLRNNLINHSLYGSNNFLQDIVHQIQELRNYITSLITPIGIANDMIQDKARDRTFTQNTINFVTDRIHRLLSELNRLYLPINIINTSSMQSDLLRLRNRIDSCFSIQEFRRLVPLIRNFLNNYIDYIIRYNNQTQNNTRIQKIYNEIIGILDEINFI